jgi:polar amino acid transport system substrate-binding protein
MSMLRRKLLALAGTSLYALLLAGCAAPAPVDALVRQTLAPTGTLRVGVYPGSPTSMVRDPRTGEKAGVAMSLGLSLGQRLGVPVQVVEFERVAQVVDAVKSGAVDFTFTNASEARARDVDFTPPLIELELGYLLPANSPVTDVSEIDRPGRRVGVSQGSSSQAALARIYRNPVVLLPAGSLKQAQAMLRSGEIEAFATNKAILFEMQDELPGFRVLSGRWGLEHLAIAVPKGREAGMPYIRQFARDVQSSGLLQSFIAKAGLRGVSKSQ